MIPRSLLTACIVVSAAALVACGSDHPTGSSPHGGGSSAGGGGGSGGGGSGGGGSGGGGSGGGGSGGGGSGGGGSGGGGTASSAPHADFWMPYSLPGTQGYTAINAENFTASNIADTWSSPIHGVRFHSAGELNSGVLADLRPHSMVYEQLGKWFRVGLRTTDTLTATQISSESTIFDGSPLTPTSYCNSAILDTDYTKPDAALLIYQLAGPDNRCSTSDDTTWSIHLNDATTTAPQRLSSIYLTSTFASRWGITPFYQDNGQLGSVLMPDASNNLVLYDAKLQNPKTVFTCDSGGPNALCSSVGADKVDNHTASSELSARNSNDDAFITVHLDKTGPDGLIRGQGTLLLQISSDGTLVARMQLSPGCDIISTASDGKKLYMIIGQDTRSSGTCSNTPVMQQLPLDTNAAATTMLTPAAFTDTKTGETFPNPLIVGLTQNKVAVRTWASSQNTIADRLELIDKTASNLATPPTALESVGTGRSINNAMASDSHVSWWTAVTDTAGTVTTDTAKIADESGNISMPAPNTQPSRWVGAAFNNSYKIRGNIGLGGGTDTGTSTHLVLASGGTVDMDSKDHINYNGAALFNYDLTSASQTQLTTLTNDASLLTIMSGPIGLGEMQFPSTGTPVTDLFAVNFTTNQFAYFPGVR
jgi:hypothetical protein